MLTKKRPHFILRYPFLWLAIIPFAIYFKTVFMEFTELDDSFFVVQNAKFNKDPGNLTKVFHRGLFVETQDVYYRPIFLVDMILEYQFFGTKPWGYHLTNILFNILAGCLLYLLFLRLKIPEPPALLLSLLFTIHPVLSQAVAWIPGRNDLLLMIFFLSTLIFSIDYYKNNRWQHFALQFLFSLLAILTKETAIIIPAILFILLPSVYKPQWKKILLLAGSWALVILVWYSLRATSKPFYPGMLAEEMTQSGIHRFPAILQYLGKIFFPFNLSAVPYFEEISLVWGVVAFVLLSVLIILSKSYSKPLTILGVCWFILFLLPVLFVPKNLNDQVYEHRLYIPIIGILLIFSQTLLFSAKWKQAYLFTAGGALILFFSILTFFRLDCYKNPDIFWTQAVKDSPRSAFATLNLGKMTKDPVLKEKLIRKAYELNPQQMLVNFHLGLLSQEKKRYDSASIYFKRELSYANFAELYFRLASSLYQQKKLDSSAYYLTKGLELDPKQPEAVKNLANIWFSLAEHAYTTGKLDSAAFYLEKVIRVNPSDNHSFHNLAMLYFQMNQRENAIRVINEMKMNGIGISDDLLNLEKTK
ncbi:MAG: glycosyltransferase family 39 protein [Bacteroidetes bacterium]|nr:glycosyltransferase family 39 protein [Bacteroidota bacterium]